MKRFSPQVLAALAISIFVGIAVAAPAINIDQVGRWVKGPLYVGTDGRGVSTNAITQSLATTFNVNITFDGGCQEVTTALTGASVGDVCSVSPWVAPGTGNAYTCYVSAADVVSVRQCPAGSDPPDSGFSVRILSSL